MTDPPERRPDLLGAAFSGAERTTYVPGDCPDEEDLAGFAEGTLLQAESDRVLGHLAGCAACRDLVRGATGDLAAAGRLPATGEGKSRFARERTTPPAARDACLGNWAPLRA